MLWHTLPNGMKGVANQQEDNMPCQTTVPRSTTTIVRAISAEIILPQWLPLFSHNCPKYRCKCDFVPRNSKSWKYFLTQRYIGFMQMWFSLIKIYWSQALQYMLHYVGFKTNQQIFSRACNGRSYIWSHANLYTMVDSGCACTYPSVHSYKLNSRLALSASWSSIFDILWTFCQSCLLRDSAAL